MAEPKILTTEEALKLAREIVAGIPAVAESCGNGVLGLMQGVVKAEVTRATLVAQALIERLEPVILTRDVINICACKGLVFGYTEDRRNRIAPQFCEQCGRPIQWT